MILILLSHRGYIDTLVQTPELDPSEIEILTVCQESPHLHTGWRPWLVAQLWHEGHSRVEILVLDRDLRRTLFNSLTDSLVLLDLSQIGIK